MKKIFFIKTQFLASFKFIKKRILTKEKQN